jgi:hypothetical protein
MVKLRIIGEDAWAQARAGFHSSSFETSVVSAMVAAQKLMTFAKS